MTVKQHLQLWHWLVLLPVGRRCTTYSAPRSQKAPPFRAARDIVHVRPLLAYDGLAHANNEPPPVAVRRTICRPASGFVSCRSIFAKTPQLSLSTSADSSTYVMPGARPQTLKWEAKWVLRPDANAAGLVGGNAPVGRACLCLFKTHSFVMFISRTKNSKFRKNSEKNSAKTQPKKRTQK